MSQLLVLLLIISCSAGFVAVAVLILNYRRYRYRPVRSFIGFLLCDVALTVATSALYYVVVNITGGPILPHQLILLITCFLDIAALYFLIEFGRGVTPSPLIRILRLAFFCVYPIIVLGHMFMPRSLFPNTLLTDFIASPITRALAYIGFLAAISILWLYESRKKKPRAQRRVLAGLALLFLALCILTTVDLATAAFHLVSSTTLLISNYIRVFVFYLIIIFFSERFTRDYFQYQETADKRAAFFRKGVKTYSISKRESEIVDLICRGKTNQEIADALFISIFTVKEHITNIYKKTGVSNRVNLTNLFTKD